MYSFLLIFVVIVSFFSFYWKLYFSIELSVFIILIVTLKNILFFKANKIKLLSLLFYLIYILPFIHLLEYFWTDVSAEAPLVMWGLLTREGMLDLRAVSLTGMIGCVGAVGISLAFSLKKLKLSTDEESIYKDKKYRTISLVPWFAMLIIGVVLSNLTAPKSTILTAGYGESTSALESANFSSSWMVSYSILTFLFVDSFFEKRKVEKRLKWYSILFAITYILVFNQILRGDRDALPWIVSLLTLKFYWKMRFLKDNENSTYKTPYKLILFFSVIFFSSMFIGMFRNSLTDLNSFSDLINILADNSEIIISNILHGTWSAVLLTPLSLSYDYIYNSLSFNFGRDYLDLVLSAPPGFIADFIGYSRPWDINPDPAMKLVNSETSTGGGLHLSAMAFWNFGILGVVIGSFLWGYLIKILESNSLKNSAYKGMSLIGVCTLAMPHAVWYGEKNFFNALIIWFFIYYLIINFVNHFQYEKT